MFEVSKLAFVAFFGIIILKDVSSYSSLSCLQCNSANKADCDSNSDASKVVHCDNEYERCHCISVASINKEKNKTIYTRNYYPAPENYDACDQLEVDTGKRLLYCNSCDYEYTEYPSHKDRYCNDEDFPSYV